MGRINTLKPLVQRRRTRASATGTPNMYQWAAYYVDRKLVHSMLKWILAMLGMGDDDTVVWGT